MNEDEMIEEMAKITNYTAFDFTQGAIESATIYTAMAEALYNAGYRKIEDNEMVFNAYQLHDEFKKHRQETARKILQIVDGRLDIHRLGIFGREIEYDKKDYKRAIKDIKMLIKANYELK